MVHIPIVKDFETGAVGMDAGNVRVVLTTSNYFGKIGRLKEIYPADAKGYKIEIPIVSNKISVIGYFCASDFEVYRGG